jgi:hypothetical protein
MGVLSAYACPFCLFCLSFLPADAFYSDLLVNGGGAIAALNWKNAWDAALREASQNSED